MELDYHLIHWDQDAVEQTASYIAPLIRGRSSLGSHPVVKFQEWTDVSPKCFFEHARFTSAEYVPAQELRELYSTLCLLPPETALIAVEKLGVFACAETAEKAQMSLEKLLCRPQTHVYTQIKHDGRMSGKVFVVTGGAQGLGRNVAQILLEEGAYVVLADINFQKAHLEATAFCKTFGYDRAIAIQTDVSSAESVEKMCMQTVLHYGGIDVMFSNAGIVIPGDLEHLRDEDLTKVFSVNCLGYFHCAKYAARYMKIQKAVSENYIADIINTSSVAGLIGYPRNSPYCATKFGVLGMTECFAKELLPYRIKVNSICPGNYLDGPLWSDPEKGLFLQYLQAGKVPNGKTIQDSIHYYCDREPFKRGLRPRDLAQAVMYCVEQQFETGIALPVTGGLAMGALQ